MSLRVSSASSSLLYVVWGETLVAFENRQPDPTRYRGSGVPKRVFREKAPQAFPVACCCLSGAGAPVGQERREVASIDDSVAIEILGPRDGSPCPQEHGQVEAVDLTVSIEVAEA